MKDQLNGHVSRLPWLPTACSRGWYLPPLISGVCIVGPLLYADCLSGLRALSTHVGRCPGSGIMEANDRQVTSFHSPTVIPPSALDKPRIMKPYHHRRTCRHTSPRRLLTMVMLHDTRFVSSADGGMTVRLWKLSSFESLWPPWYRPQGFHSAWWWCR